MIPFESFMNWNMPSNHLPPLVAYDPGISSIW